MGGSAERRPIVFVVSGLPRSGTSMMMRMLAEGGAPILADAARSADADNPRGYYELEAVKATARDASWVTGAPGCVVKVISSLLPHLPDHWTYRVVFMRRGIDQIVRSQRAMLDRLGNTPMGEDERAARHALARHLVDIECWLETARHMRILGVGYERVLAEPAREIDRICRFLELELDVAAMRRAVEPALQRQKIQQESA
ncbi:MAG: sulfotransferase [Kofleriaceae bacterium]